MKFAGSNATVGAVANWISLHWILQVRDNVILTVYDADWMGVQALFAG
jgi:hypothetical protein